MVTRIKKSETLVPNSMRQADALLSKLGQTQDAINEIEKELANKIAELKASTTKKLEPLTVGRSNQINALFAFANPLKAVLSRETKSIVLGSGAFGWRWTPPRVEMIESDEETIALLKNTGNDAFVRIIEEVDRQALLAERPLIEGISYVQNEEFFVVPRQKYRKAKTFTKVIDR